MKQFVTLLICLTWRCCYCQDAIEERFPDLVYAGSKSEIEQLQDRITSLRQLIAHNRLQFGFSPKQSEGKIFPVKPNIWNENLQNYTELYLVGADTVKSNYYKLDKTLRDIRGTLSIIPTQNSWPPNKRLKVCFCDGNNLLAKKIASVAFEWNRNRYVELYVEKPEHYSSCTNCSSCIRVSTDEQRVPDNVLTIGSDWAVTGNSEDSNSSSMFANVYFHRLEDERDDKMFRYRVLHEFGHVLGIRHEHQHPLNVECPVDEEAALGTISKRIVSLDPSQAGRVNINSIKKIVKENYLFLEKTKDIFFSNTFDSLSVLNYVLTKDFYKPGINKDCYKKRYISTLSELDIKYYNDFYLSRIAETKTLNSTNSFKTLKFNPVTGILKYKETITNESESIESIVNKAKDTINNFEKFIEKQIR